MYDEKRFEVELNKAKSLSQVVALVNEACGEIEKSAVISLSNAFNISFKDKPLHSIFYCVSLGLNHTEVMQILDDEETDRFTKAAQLVVNQLVADSRISKFSFSNSIDVALAEAPFLVFAFNLKINSAIFFAERFDDAFTVVLHYFPVLARAKLDCKSSVDKWGNFDEGKWEKLLIDFANEKLNLDSWRQFLLKPEVNSLSVGQHFSSGNFESVGVRFTKLLINTAFDDKEQFLDLHSPYFDVNTVANFQIS